MEEHKIAAASAGADAHITKPITPESLVAGIEAALNAPNSEAASAVG
jgi:DNA-binding response OmpR family regulator